MCGVRKLTRAAYAISAYDASCETSPKLNVEKRNTVIALRVSFTRGVFHHSCFSTGRLAMPHMRRGDWEHATLLFCARECRIGQRGKGSQE